jgi:hypothetical protein
MALGRPLSPLTLVPAEREQMFGVDSPSQDGEGPGIAGPASCCSAPRGGATPRSLAILT